MLSSLITLPNELLIYTLRNFLDLADLWSLLQTNSKLRYFAATVIYNTWKIDLKAPSDKNINIQSRAILISLEILATQLSFEHDSHPTMKPYIIESIVNTDISTSIVNFLTAGPSIILNTQIEHQEDISHMDNYNQSILCDENTLINDNNDYRSNEDITFHHQQWLQHQNYQSYNKKMLMSDKIKLIKSLVLKEEKLHSRVIEGISSYKHKYVLIEDIDIRNRIRTTVDVIFHHAVFVSAISRRRTTAHVACTTTHTNVNYRALAAVMVRLLTRLDAAFPSYCREITYTLADNIKAFLEYTGYKLLAMRKENGRGASNKTTRGHSIHQLKNNNHTHRNTNHNHNHSTRNHHYSNNNNNNRNSTDNNNDDSDNSRCLCSVKIPPSLTLTLQSIAACFDLIGAAFIGKLLTDDHVERAIQRTCELLNHSKHHGSDIFITFKRKILVDIMNNWLNIKREMGSSEICRFIRAEIDKCDQHQRKVGLLVEHLLVT